MNRPTGDTVAECCWRQEFLLICFDDRTGKKIIASDKIEPGLGDAGPAGVEGADRRHRGVCRLAAAWPLALAAGGVRRAAVGGWGGVPVLRRRWRLI